MTMMNNQQQVNLDYNSSIEATENEFITLQPGTYAFTVTDVAYDSYQPGPNASGKIPAGTKKVILTLNIECEQGIANVKDTFFIHPTTSWRITAVHKCLGLLPEDYKGNFNMNWGSMAGRSGWVKIKNEQGTTNTNMLFHKVDSYLKPSQFPVQQAPATQTTPSYNML